MIILLTTIEFLCGSLMFSYWLGLAARKDLRQEGDGNPGAYNLWRAAGFKFGILGVFLDFIKGYIPLVLLVESGMIGGLAIVPVAIAPVFGHIFSPFMKFRGGKGIAVTFGVWSAVTKFNISILYAIILAVILFIARLLRKGKPTTTETDAFMVVSGMGILGIYMISRSFSENLILLWILNTLLLTYTNKTKLQAFWRNQKGRFFFNSF